MALEEAIRRFVVDGCSIALGAMVARESMAVCYEIVRQGKKNLTLIKDSSVEPAEILKYWNFKRPHSWKKADEGKLDYVLTKYNITKIKYYIDRVIDDERGWADFDSVITALEENKYE